MSKCKFCMYNRDCGDELPGDNGKCIAFCVPMESAADYEKWLKEQTERKQAEELRERLILAALLEG